MASRTSSILILICLAIAASAGDAVPAKPAQRPNILFVLSDDQRWDSLGCYGNSVVRTPACDGLAATGARLDAFYVASPLCCPSRASLLTGRYPHQHGVTRNSLGVTRGLPVGMATLPRHLAAAGYAVGLIGKTHLTKDPRPWGFTETPLWFPGDPGGRYEDQLALLRAPEGSPQPPQKGHITQVLADAAIAFIQGHRGQPWFLWWSPTMPHPPFYRHGGPKDPHAASPPGWPTGVPIDRTVGWKNYYASVMMLDQQFGRVLAALDAEGQAASTMVVFISDNGFMMGSRGLNNKRVWFDESARVPALVRWPGHITSGIQIDAPLVSVDLVPTFLEAAGAEPIPGLEAQSMLPVLTGAAPLRQAAFAEVDPTEKEKEGVSGPWQMVRDRRYKYVTTAKTGERLYDLDTDPSELHDLSGDPTRTAEMERMRGLLAEWARRTP